MKKRLLLFIVAALACLSGIRAAGIVSIANVRNVVPGYTGSLDLVLTSENTQLFCAYQFDMTLPEGLTFASAQLGSLLDGHNCETSDQGGNTTRFTGYVFPTRPFSGTTGTLLTISFDVSGSYSGIHQVDFKDIIFTIYSTGTAESFDVPAFSADIVGSSSVEVSLDEDDAAAPSTISGADVTVNRAFKAGVWHTLCLPFAMSSSQVTAAFGSDVQIGDLSSVSYDYQTIDGDPEVTGITLNFSSVSSIEAHHPYIIKVQSAVSSFTVSGVDITQGTPEVNVGSGSKYRKMTGTYVADVTIPEGGLYLLDNQFRYSAGSSYLKAYHAWFDLDKKLYDYNVSAGAPRRTVGIGGMGDGTTGISQSVKVQDVNPDGPCYNIQGQRVGTSVRGLYIVNGKKVIIK